MVDSEAATTAFGNLAVSNENDSGGAIAKFKKKDKKKKKKPKFWLKNVFKNKYISSLLYLKKKFLVKNA